MQDIQLVNHCLQQKPEKQKLLYDTYLPYVLTIVRRYGVASSQEPDVIQEIFIEIFTTLHKYNEDRGSLKTWIRTLTVRKFLNIKRKQGKLLIVEITDATAHASDVMINYQVHSPTDILAAIASIPDGYRTVFNLYEVDGYNHKEIAALLGITSAGSRSQLSRARSLLRKILANHKYMTK